MRFPRVDASIICFALVVVAAVPVAALRSRTYSIGYSLGELKKQERQLRQKNIELKSQLATTQRTIRDKYFGNAQKRKPATGELVLPENHQIMHRGGEGN
jgi:hypothetical protein